MNKLLIFGFSRLRKGANKVSSASAERRPQAEMLTSASVGVIRVLQLFCSFYMLSDRLYSASRHVVVRLCQTLTLAFVFFKTKPVIRRQL